MTGIRGESLENSTLTGEAEESRQQKPTLNKITLKNAKMQNDPKNINRSVSTKRSHVHCAIIGQFTSALE